MNTSGWKELQAERSKVKIIDKTQTQTFDLNTVLDVFYSNTPEGLEPLDGALSVISGAPAIRYERTDYNFLLTGDEVRRLVLRALTPKEFFALCREIGDIFVFEIHGYFYDPETGFARQPIIDLPQFWPQGTGGFFFADLHRNSYQDSSYVLQDTLSSIAKDLVELQSHSLYLGALDSKFTLQEKIAYNSHIRNAVVVLTPDTLGQPKAVADIKYLIKCGVRIIIVWIDVSQDDVLPLLPTLKDSEGITFQELDMQEMIGVTTLEDGMTVPQLNILKAPRFANFVQTIMWSVLPPAQILEHLHARNIDVAAALAYASGELRSHVQTLLRQEKI